MHYSLNYVSRAGTLSIRHSKTLFSTRVNSKRMQTAAEGRRYHAVFASGLTGTARDVRRGKWDMATGMGRNLEEKLKESEKGLGEGIGIKT